MANLHTKTRSEYNIEYNTISVISGSSSFELKCLNILKSNPRQQFNAQTIDQVLSGKLNYHRDLKRIAKIRTALNRLADKSKIRRMKRGYFQAKANLETIAIIESPMTKLHGIKIEIKKIEGISSHCNMLTWLKTKHFRSITNAKGTSLKRSTKQIGWRDRWITMTVHESNFIEIFLNAGDMPISYEEFCSFCDFMDGYLEPYFFTRSNAYVTMIGIGKDYEELHLDGLKAIRLHKFKNDWCSIYEREDGRVRFEHHLKLNITLEDAINIMSLISTPPRYAHQNNSKEDDYKDVA